MPSTEVIGSKDSERELSEPPAPKGTFGGAKEPDDGDFESDTSSLWISVRLARGHC